MCAICAGGSRWRVVEVVVGCRHDEERLGEVVVEMLVMLRFGCLAVLVDLHQSRCFVPLSLPLLPLHSQHSPPIVLLLHLSGHSRDYR